MFFALKLYHFYSSNESKKMNKNVAFFIILWQSNEEEKSGGIKS